MNRIVLAALGLLASGTAALASDPWLFVQPGMNALQGQQIWKDSCGSFVLTENDGEENYLTCVMDNGGAITANVAPDGTVWWARFWSKRVAEREAFAAHFTTELGLSGEPASCTHFDEAADCWTVGSVLVTLPHERDVDGWAVMLEDRTIFDPD